MLQQFHMIDVKQQLEVKKPLLVTTLTTTMTATWEMNDTPKECVLYDTAAEYSSC